MTTFSTPGVAYPAIATCRNSPPPAHVLPLIPRPAPRLTSVELPQLPRPGVVFGSMPCERFASTVAALTDVAYILLADEVPAPDSDLDQWVDDIVIDPSSPEELAAAGVRALQRKQRSHKPRPVISDTTFAWCGQLAEISRLEARILRRLVRAQGAVVGKQDLAAELWGNYFCDPGRAVDTHIYRIRRRLQGIRGVAVETARQRGFRLVLELPPEALAS